MRHALPALLCAALSAGSWAPIPPEVWAMKEDPAKGITGAVVLESSLDFEHDFVQHTYRVRILGEGGRRAAAPWDFPEEAHDIEGRTVRRDGSEVVFQKRSDFLVREELGGSGDKRPGTVVVPPGVTSDCVVEVRWKEDVEWPYDPLPRRFGTYHEWRIGGPFPIQLFSIRLASGFPWEYSIQGSSLAKAETQDDARGSVCTFRDVPVVEPVPFSLEPMRPYPRFKVFWPGIGGPSTGPERYWNAVAKSFDKYWLKESDRGKAFDALSTELRAGLPADPQQAAGELYMRLQARIKNLDAFSYAELGALSPEDLKRVRKTKDWDLNKLAAQGMAPGIGLTTLLFNILWDQGIRAKVALAADRTQTIFEYDYTNRYQLSPLLVVASAGKPDLWLDPSLRFAAPGLIHPDYQGTEGLLLDPLEGTAKRIRVPAQSSGFNRSQYEYGIRLTDDAEAFTLKAGFSGFPEYAERARYREVEAKEQSRVLKEVLEARMPGATLSKTEVAGVLDPRVNMGWSAEGSLEQESGRRREVDPFPGLPLALSSPGHWPEARVDQIVLPYLSTQLALSHVAVPEGYAAQPQPPLKKANGYGQVSWSLDTSSPTQATVMLQVMVTGLSGTPSTAKDLRDFLAWIEEASRRKVVLERAR